MDFLCSMGNSTQYSKDQYEKESKRMDICIINTTL